MPTSARRPLAASRHGSMWASTPTNICTAPVGAAISRPCLLKSTIIIPARAGGCQTKGGRPMDLNQLQSFQAVAKTLSFTGAARRLGVPQSTVSRHISDLEQQLGAKLFYPHQARRAAERRRPHLFALRRGDSCGGSAGRGGGGAAAKRCPGAAGAGRVGGAGGAFGAVRGEVLPGLPRHRGGAPPGELRPVPHGRGSGAPTTCSSCPGSCCPRARSSKASSWARKG